MYITIINNSHDIYGDSSDLSSCLQLQVWDFGSLQELWDMLCNDLAKATQEIPQLGMTNWLTDMVWLVVKRHPSEKYEFVNWDDEIPNMNGKIQKMATKPPTWLPLDCHLMTLIWWP